MLVFGIPWQTIALLVLSNLFMTVAWYGHLKYHNVPLWQAILASWMIALLEYCFQVPANRIGYGDQMSPSQLKVIQECITLLIFAGFTTVYFKEQLHWNHAVSFLLLIGAVYFAFQKV
jgi:uncharacterized protein